MAKTRRIEKLPRYGEYPVEVDVEPRQYRGEGGFFCPPVKIFPERQVRHTLVPARFCAGVHD